MGTGWRSWYKMSQRAGRFGVWIPVEPRNVFFSTHAQTDKGNHTVSWAMGTENISQERCGWGVAFTNHSHLTARLRMSGTIFLFPLITFFLLCFVFFISFYPFYPLCTSYPLSSCRLFFCNIQHKNPCPGGIQTRNSTRLAAPDLRPKPRGHRDRLSQRLLEKTFTFAWYNHSYQHLN